MSDILEKARALWAAIRAAWDKLRGKEDSSKANDSGGGGGPKPTRSKP
mgnify:FL=1